SGLCRLVKRTVGLSDLDRAIVLLEEAVRNQPADQRNRPTFCDHLAILLGERYERYHDPNDLNRAIELLSGAIAETPTEAPALPGRLTNLGNRLITRARATGSQQDAQAAVGACRRSLNI